MSQTKRRAAGKDDDEVAAGPPMGTDDGLGDLASVLGFHIRLAHGTVYRHIAETFSVLDLTQKQVSVLWLVDARPGIAQTDLSRILRMDRATTMAIVNASRSAVSSGAAALPTTGGSRRCSSRRRGVRRWPPPRRRCGSMSAG